MKEALVTKASNGQVLIEINGEISKLLAPNESARILFDNLIKLQEQGYENKFNRKISKDLDDFILNLCSDIRKIGK